VVLALAVVLLCASPVLARAPAFPSAGGLAVAPSDSLVPDISVSPDSLSCYLLTGGTETQLLHIENLGEAELAWSIELYDVPDSTSRSQGLADLTGIGILFDRSHGSLSSSYWDVLVSDLTGRGAILDENLDPVTSEVLAPYDVLWVARCEDTWGAGELAAVAGWVQAGGGLLLTGESDHSVNANNALLNALGAEITLQYGPAGQGTTRNIYAHPTTVGVWSLTLSPFASLSHVADPAVVLVEDNEFTPNSACSAIGAGRVVVVGDELFMSHEIDDADERVFGNHIFDWLVGLPGWLSAEPGGGVLTAGAHIDVSMTFDATDMTGGSRVARVGVVSNDPDEPEVSVPVWLGTIPAADITISDTEFSFGLVFVGAARVETLTVTNDGALSLEVSSIDIDNGDFYAMPTSFTLDPRYSRDVSVVFTPTAAGPSPGTLTITSNDPDESPILIPLEAEGLDPPVLIVSPDSLHAELVTGETDEQVLTIENAGPGELEWELEVARVPGRARDESGRTYPDPLNGVSILWDRSHGQTAMHYYWEDIRDDLEARGVTFTSNWDTLALDLLRDHDIVWSNTCNTPLTQEELLALKVWVKGGGSLLLSEGHDVAVDIFNDVLASVGSGIEFSAVDGDDGYTDNIYAHETTEGVEWVRLSVAPSHLSQVPPPAVLLIEDSDGVANSACSEVGQGRVASIADRMFQDSNYYHVDVGIFAHQLFEWLSGVRWLSAAPDQGTISGVGSTDVTVTFDATGLLSGTHSAGLIVRSNDPVVNTLFVPADLLVAGAPDAVVSDSLLSFGAVLVGNDAVLTFALANESGEDLVVSDISSDHGDYTAAPSNFTLPPARIQVVEVTFAPSAPGPAPSTLTVASDDPYEPEIGISLYGEGVPPPDISVAPDSVYADLDPDQMSEHTFTIRNTGATDLNWWIRVRDHVERQTDARLSTKLTTGSPSRQLARSPGRLADLTGLRVLWDASHGPWASIWSWGTVIGDIEARGAVVTENHDPITLDLLVGYDILWAIEFEDPWTPDELTALDYWVSCGGSLILEGDMSYSNFNEILSVLGAGMLFTPGGGDGVTYDVSSHPTTENVESIYLVSAGCELTGVTSPATVLIRDVVGDPNTACSEVGCGRIIAMADELLTNSHMFVADNQLFGNQVFDWFAGPRWLNLSALQGTTVPGDSTSVTVTLDSSGLFGGDYRADIAIISNDPDESEVVVEAHLHVSGIPDIAVSDTLLTYGAVEVGSQTARELIIANRGTAVLTVMDISSDNGDFWPLTEPTAIAPQDSTAVSIMFGPSTEGPVYGTLSITTDDPDEGVVEVSLQGEGYVVPDLYVPHDAPTIQAAIDMSGPTGRIMVATGMYEGEGNRGLNFHGRNIELVSEYGSGGTYIQCDGEDRGFQFTNGEGPGALVRGFTILGGASDYGGGMYIVDASPTIEDCVFTDCDAHQEGAGVFMTGSSATFSECWFLDNTVGWGGGGGIRMSESSPSIDSCIFRGNTTLSEGGAGIMCSASSNAVITGCEFTENTAHLRGGAIDCSNSSPTIANCTLAANSAIVGSGIGMNAASPTIANTIVAFGQGGGALACGGASTPTLSHCCVFANAGGDSLCGLYHDNLFLDPLLCDPLEGNSGLCQNSVCLPGGNPWGELIGALGEACGECTATDVSGDVCAVPVLHPAVPNPFAGTTTIRFEVPLDAVHVGLSVFNLRGERVRALDTASGRGIRSVTWDGRDSLGRSVASGVYFLRLEVDGRRESRKVLILR